MEKKRGLKLHHTVTHTPAEEIAKSIGLNGLVPQVADAYKDLVPEEIRHLPVVWLAEGIWQGWDFPVFEVDGKDLDAGRLYHTTVVYEVDKDLNRWVYQGKIPAHLIKRQDWKRNEVG